MKKGKIIQCLYCKKENFYELWRLRQKNKLGFFCNTSCCMKYRILKNGGKSLFYIDGKGKERGIKKWYEERKFHRGGKGKLLNFISQFQRKSFNPNLKINLPVYTSFQIPYDTFLSKNKLNIGRGKLYHSQAYIKAQEVIGLLLNTKKITLNKENKVWLDIFVERPDLRTDAINFLDGIADAIKKVIDIDDRWFSIRRLDWEIVKKNPMITIGIGQEIQKFLCQNCKRFLSLEEKQNKTLCKDCFFYKKEELFIN